MSKCVNCKWQYKQEKPIEIPIDNFMIKKIKKCFPLDEFQKIVFENSSGEYRYEKEN